MLADGGVPLLLIVELSQETPDSPASLGAL
jgi:hypothetical protein